MRGESFRSWSGEASPSTIGCRYGFALISPDGFLEGVSERRAELAARFNKKIWRKLYDQGWRVEPVAISAILIARRLRIND